MPVHLPLWGQSDRQLAYYSPGIISCRGGFLASLPGFLSQNAFGLCISCPAVDSDFPSIAGVFNLSIAEDAPGDYDSAAGLFRIKLSDKKDSSSEEVFS
ncbi:MAG TPA: hypothetical protein DER60_02830 [Syntrophomonas sp.]|nr:hypothetical protein [Syntrophomonas sp.]